ncbi:MAG: hypothetical protein Q8L92_15490, partial [Rubrivivax sp.]|nr:hypothetical protein [Rubrivivax sp.]
MFGQWAGVMGDRLTFSGAQGASLNFSFNFDGSMVSPAQTYPASLLQIGVIANLRVFDSGAGATSSNFAALAGALASDTRFLQFDNPTTALDELINEALAGSFVVGNAGPLALDVFASLSIFVSTNDNPGTITMDFLNIGTFGLQVDSGVTVSSASVV